MLPPELEGIEFTHDIRERGLDYASGGVWAEFGVFKGNSTRHILHRMPDDTTIHLFDSFEGLPEVWDMGEATRDIIRFKLEEHEIPVFNEIRATIHKGWFKDTLPKADMGVLNFVHIDCDLYSSTKTVLEYIEVSPGTIIVFDEYHGYPNYENHERKAYQEWSERTGYELEWLAYGRQGAMGRVQ